MDVAFITLQEIFCECEIDVASITPQESSRQYHSIRYIQGGHTLTHVRTSTLRYIQGGHPVCSNMYTQTHTGHMYTHTHTCSNKYTHAHTGTHTLKRLLSKVHLFFTGWRTSIECLVSKGRFPQKSPTSSGSSTENDLFCRKRPLT